MCVILSGHDDVDRRNTPVSHRKKNLKYTSVSNDSCFDNKSEAYNIIDI